MEEWREFFSDGIFSILINLFVDLVNAGFSRDQSLSVPGESLLVSSCFFAYNNWGAQVITVGHQPIIHQKNSTFSLKKVIFSSRTESVTSTK